MKSNLDRTLPPADRDNVVMFRPRRPQRAEAQDGAAETRRYPVVIRGNVTFGQLMKGLATVGLTVRVDARTGQVVISNDPFE